MAYSLLRKNTVKSVLRSDCFKVQDPWSLALLTKLWYKNIGHIRMPFLEELSFRNYVHLRKHGTTKTSQLPSAECLRIEREYEMKRQSYLRSQKQLAKQIGSSLRGSPVGFRRPLPP
ncbi:uncharacterized protein C4orf36 homolog [Sorex fumeus]|uniref:uncharacterized protein C4orf36 homolog n=1 Tax=Sorex fumeus TaxID=62283 RepID=UPI0024ADAC4C|nr:uncharacterized protein C4orf36 homolog [Sorex fumeus]